MQEKNSNQGFRLPFLSAVARRHRSVKTIMMRWLMQLGKLLLLLMVLPLLVLISLVFLISYFWNQGKVLSVLSKVSEEESERQKTKTSSRYGILHQHANLQNVISLKEKRSTEKPPTPSRYKN